MSARPSIDEFSQRIKELMASSPLADVERNLKALASHAIARMELVTREEFDAQSRVLGRTLERLEALESRVAALEAGARNIDTPR